MPVRHDDARLMRVLRLVIADNLRCSNTALEQSSLDRRLVGDRTGERGSVCELDQGLTAVYVILILIYLESLDRFASDFGALHKISRHAYLPKVLDATQIVPY